MVRVLLLMTLMTGMQLQVVELPASTRVVIVGDVHACLDELQALLVACAFDASQDQLVLVGDLVNKGPKSVEVLQMRCIS